MQPVGEFLGAGFEKCCKMGRSVCTRQHLTKGDSFVFAGVKIGAVANRRDHTDRGHHVDCPPGLGVPRAMATAVAWVRQ